MFFNSDGKTSGNQRADAIPGPAVSPKLAWKFEPSQKSVTVETGDTVLAFYKYMIFVFLKIKKTLDDVDCCVELPI